MAASKSRVEVTGVKECQRALRDLGADVADLSAVHRKVVEGLLPGVALRTPRRTGALAGSWSAGSTKTRGRIQSSKRYAGVIEFGWAARKIQPASMARDTIAAETGSILETYESEIARLAKGEGFEVTRS